MRRRWIALAAVVVPMVAAMAAGAIWGYPIFDDAYYLSRCASTTSRSTTSGR
jgi:hypothetical protein